MKTHEKKKAFKAFCRKQAHAGLINREDGTWTRINTTSGEARNMHACYAAGYRVGRK